MGRARSSGSRRLVRFVAVFGAFVVAAVPVVGAAPALADSTVKASPQQVNELLFGIGQVMRCSSDATMDLCIGAPMRCSSGSSMDFCIGNPVRMTTMAVGQDMFEANPGTSPEQAAAELKALEDSAGSAASGDPPAANASNDYGYLSVLRAFEGYLVEQPQQEPIVQETEQAVQATTKQALEDSAASGGFSGNELAADPGSQDMLTSTSFLPQAQFSASWELAHSNPSFGQVWNDLFAQSGSENIFDSSSKLISENPALQGPEVQQLTSLLRPDGSISTSESSLLGMANQDLLNIGQLTLNEEQNPGISSSQATSNENALKDAGASMAGVGALLGLVDKRAGKDVDLLGNAVVKIGTAFDQWSAATKGLDVLQTLGSFSTAALTGNIIQAVASLAPLFINTPPSLEQIISKQIATLQKDLDSFETKVGQRFDRIDSELSQIYKGLSTQLASLAQQLAAQSVTISEFYDTLTKLQEQIDQLQVNLYQAIADASGRDLWQEINYAIGYQQRSPGGMSMPADQFAHAASFFYTWATNSAFDSVALGPAPQPADFAPDGVWPRLGFGLERNLEYFNEFPAAVFGLSPLSASPLPNPHDWAVAANALSELLLENPQYATQGVLVGQLDPTISLGSRLDGALASIAQSDRTPTGNGLFDHLLDNYRHWGYGTDSGTGATLKDALSADQADYLKTLVAAAHPKTVTGESSTFKSAPDLWGGPEQAPDSYPTITTASGCPDTSTVPSGVTSPTPPSLPSNFTQKGIVANSYLLARRMLTGADPGKGINYNGVQDPTLGGDISVSCDGQWVNETAGRSCTTQGVCTYTYDANLQVTLTWRYTTSDNKPLTIATLTYTSPRKLKVCTTNGDTGSCDSYLNQPGWRVAQYWTTPNWDGDGDNLTLKQEVEQSATITDGGTKATIENAVSNWLTQQQKLLYDGILNTGQAWDDTLLGAGSLSHGPLHDAAQRLAGAGGLLASYIELGLQPALVNDDTLRSLVLGQNRLLDQDAVQRISAIYDQAITAPPASDEATLIENRIQSDADALQSELSNILAAQPPAGAAPNRPRSTQPTPDQSPLGEHNPLVAYGLLRLELTRDVLAWELGGAHHSTRPGVISHLALTPTSFTAAPTGPTILPASSHSTFGTIVSYNDSAAGTTVFRVLRPVTGRMQGGRCVKRTHKNRDGHRCTYYLTAGSFTHADRNGQNRFRFTGRINGHTLPANGYALQAQTHDSAGKGQPVQTAFSVRTRRRHRARVGA